MTTTDQTTQTRQIKVSQFYYDYKPKNAPSNFIVPPVPWLQLKGKWLEKAGFSINAPVKVTVSQGCLILTTK